MTPLSHEHNGSSMASTSQEVASEGEAEQHGVDGGALANGTTAAAAAPSSTKTHKLILTPPADIVVNPPPPLSAQQQAKVDELRAYVVDLHTTTLASDDAYYAFEEAWVHEDVLPERYLDAVNWDLAAAKTRIASTLEWRRSYQPECIAPDEVKEEALTGKHFISGFDAAGRPFLTVCPRLENTKNYDAQLRYMVFSFERCLQLMPAGVSQLNLVMSLEGNTAANNPPMAQSRQALSIMQNHYPNRLARAICLQGPWFFKVFFSIIKPFIDPVTRAKVHFDPPMTSFARPDQISTEWAGGTYDYEWDFESYWAQLLEYCGLNPDGSRVEGPVPVDQNKRMGRVSKAASTTTNTTTAAATPGQESTASTASPTHESPSPSSHDDAEPAIAPSAPA